MKQTTKSSRLELLQSQLCKNKTSTINTGKYSATKHPDDIVIVGYARTALGKAGKGSFKDTQTEVLTKSVIKAVLDRSGVKPNQVQEVVFGNVLGSGSNFFKSRMSQFLGGLDDQVTLMAVNRLCSSGLQAVMNLAYSISCGQVECGIAGGVESMSLTDMNSMVDPESIYEEVFENEQARNCMVSMGMTSENVVDKYGLKRDDLDRFAFESYRKAEAAQKAGLFDKEIVPVKTTIKDKDGGVKEVVVSKDEGIRPTTLESLQKLKPAFKKDGATTAGNSSQVTDGAAAVLLMKRSLAEKLGVKVEGRILGFAVAGVPPEIMGIGPAFAIPAVLNKVGLKTSDIDIFEINEAFASQALYCIRKLELPLDKVNPKGGAIALGHPLGMTGARMICTLFTELERTKKKTGLVSMCIGTGMGAAAVFEREE